jgi:hypothetical protein
MMIMIMMMMMMMIVMIMMVNMIIMMMMPFGFIHAVISEIVRATGFAFRLFPETELWREENEEGG